MVPKRLREAREAAGMAQEKLAQLAEIETVNARSRVSNYEAGRNSPPYELVRKFASILNYPVAYFYTEDDYFADQILKLFLSDDFKQEKLLNHKIMEAKKLIEKLKQCLE